jgi:hypothetical protein
MDPSQLRDGPSAIATCEAYRMRLEKHASRKFDGRGVRLYRRNGYDFADRFPAGHRSDLEAVRFIVRDHNGYALAYQALDSGAIAERRDRS